ncbi:hypothetical protein RRG08_054813 [Elysia crispata]|uniref:Uncharacterized protein n=1 Tax=Elysia crispata TaxID=231223 RepID=A0AAE0YGA9_9GAST|nr:hypothetical protein RRG08_054813 [Elysia crispata]
MGRETWFDHIQLWTRIFNEHLVTVVDPGSTDPDRQHGACSFTQRVSSTLQVFHLAATRSMRAELLVEHLVLTAALPEMLLS